MEINGEKITSDITFEAFSAHTKKKSTERRAALGIPVSCRSDGVDDQAAHDPNVVGKDDGQTAADTHTNARKDKNQSSGLPKMPELPDISMPSMPSFGFGGSDDTAIDQELEDLRAKLLTAPENEKEVVQKEIDETEAKKKGKLPSLPKMPEMKMPSFGFGGGDSVDKKGEDGEKGKEDEGGMFGKIGGFAGGLNPMSGDKDLKALEKKLAEAADGDKEAIQKEIDEHKAKKEEGMFGGFGGFSMPSMPDLPSVPNPMGGDKELEALEKKLAVVSTEDKESVQIEIDAYRKKKEEEKKRGMKMPEMKMPSFGFGGGDGGDKKKAEDGEGETEEDGGMFGKMGGFGSGLMDGMKNAAGTAGKAGAMVPGSDQNEEPAAAEGAPK